MSDYQIKLRLLLLQITIIAVFSIFVAQLWRLQFLQGTEYQQLADRNRFRQVEVNAPRGIMYDRNGDLLVRNRPTYNVVIVPASLPDDATERAQIYARLSGLLQLPITNGGERQIASHNAYFRSFMHHEYTRLPNRQVKSSRSRLLEKSPKGIMDAVNSAPIYAPYLPVIVAEDVDPRVVAIIEEDRLNLPGVLIQTGSVREYLTGELTSQILGYVGSIPAGLQEYYPAPIYNPNDDVGLVGLEAQYEDQLHGVKGLETIEVDVTSRKVRTVGDIAPAQPGSNLTLTIDLGLQEATSKALLAAIEKSGGQSGAALALNPKNGEILAMASLPTYDNNLFAQGISAREYGLLSEDENTPLVNKAITGLYPPASTFKIIPAVGALEEGTVTPDREFVDAGVLYVPNKFFPDEPDLAQPFFGWNENGLGRMNIVSALAWSSNIYFYQVGGGYEPIGYEGLGDERLGEYARRFGYGSLTGIDLPGEAAGLIPTRKWKRHTYAETWVTGDTYNMSIGQGFVLATPLQVVNAYAAIGNGGTIYKPHFVKTIKSPHNEILYEAQPEVTGTPDISPETMGWVKWGLGEVIDSGTAASVIDVPGVNVAGKTGTADFCKRYPQCLDRNGRVRDKHAWFVAYAPREDPEIAVVLFVYDGGEGSQTAAPAVNRILRYYFGIDSLDETLDNQQATEEEPVPNPAFKPRLLGSDQYAEQVAAINGFVLDEEGNGLASVAVDLIADGEIIVQLVTGPTGQFDYNTLDSRQVSQLEVQLSTYPMTHPLKLTISASTRYYLEFQMIDTRPEVAIQQ